MLDTWKKMEFSRYPIAYPELGLIEYNLYVKKDKNKRYWMCMFSKKQPARRFVGLFRKEHNSSLLFCNPKKIGKLINDSDCYISYGDGTETAKIFETVTSWQRGPVGYDRAKEYSRVDFCNVEEYLKNFTTDEKIIKDAVEFLSVFCKEE